MAEFGDNNNQAGVEPGPSRLSSSAPSDVGFESASDLSRPSSSAPSDASLPDVKTGKAKRKRAEGVKIDDCFDRTLVDGKTTAFVCKIDKPDGTKCGKTYAGPSTSSAIDHLEAAHIEQYKTYFPTVDDNAPKVPRKTFAQDTANKLLARFVGGSTVSFNQGASEAFAQYTSYLTPIYRHPSRQMLTKYVHNEANRVVVLIKNFLTAALKVHIATDLWSQKNYRHFYCIVTASVFVESLNEQKTLCLGIKEVRDHTGDTIYADVTEILDEFGQKFEDVGVISTDNASANLKAFRDQYFQQGETDYVEVNDETDGVEGFEPATVQEDPLLNNQLTGKWLGCCNHNLNLALKVLEQDGAFSAHCSIVVQILTSIKRSSLAIRDLRELSGRSIVSICSVRWNTHYLTFNMVQDCYKHIKKIAEDRQFTDYKKFAKPAFKRYHKQIVALLKIVYLVTKELEGDEPANISKVIPTILDCVLQLEEPEPPNAFSELGGLPIKLAKEIKSRFSYALNPNSHDFSQILSAATILNPSFCVLLNAKPELLNAGKEEIGRWMARVPREERVNVHPPGATTKFERLFRASHAALPTKTWDGILDKYMDIANASDYKNPYDF